MLCDSVCSCDRAHVVAAVEGLEVDQVAALRRPQAQRVDVPPAPADHGRIVGHREDALAALPDVRTRRPFASPLLARPGRRGAPDRPNSARSNSQGLPKASQSSGRSTCQPSSSPCLNRPCS